MDLTLTRLELWDGCDRIFIINDSLDMSNELRREGLGLLFFFLLMETTDEPRLLRDFPKKKRKRTRQKKPRLTVALFLTHLSLSNEYTHRVYKLKFN